jgi:O-antigen chain-terminating methyltransferase
VDNKDLALLKVRLEEEEDAYDSLLRSLDELARFPIPGEPPSTLGDKLGALNGLWQQPAPAADSGVGAPLREQARRALAPTLARQEEFNATLVQLLNERVRLTDILHARLRDVVSTLVRYAQRILPVVDARDRLATSLGTTRAELILEAFDRRLESLGRRLEGLLALKDALGVLGEEVRGMRSALTAPPPPGVAAAAERTASDSAYVAFENRFREGDEVRSSFGDYVARFRGHSPVLDLGCGRGEFLELLRVDGIEGRGVEGNARAVEACRGKGLEVVQGDLLAFLAAQGDGSAGGVFAAQVAEHLAPAALQKLLHEAHRVLHKGGLLVLETVNPRSVTGFLEVFNRDLTHEKPLHPETLAFLAAAAGFLEVRTEYRSEVDAASRLQTVPADGLPPGVASALNENVARLNALLYGPREYALLASR